jgi:hypothetical protein
VGILVGLKDGHKVTLCRDVISVSGPVLARGVPVGEKHTIKASEITGQTIKVY